MDSRFIHSIHSSRFFSQIHHIFIWLYILFLHRCIHASSICISLCMTCRYDYKTENESSSGDEERSSKYSFVSALCMSGGEGDNSYSTNSLLQVPPNLYIFHFSWVYMHTQFNSLSRCWWIDINSHSVIVVLVIRFAELFCTQLFCL